MTPKPGYLIATALRDAAPALVVLLGLVGTDILSVRTGMIASAIVITGCGFLAFRPLQRMREINARLERLLDRPPDGAPAATPADEHGPIGDVSAALFRLERGWGRDRAQLRDSLRAAQVLFDALPDPLVTLDAQGRIVYANATARELLEGRHGVADLSGRDLSAVIRQPAILQAVEQVLGGTSTRTVEFTFTDRVDQTFEARVEPIRADTSGEDDARALILMRDVTALRRGEQMRADFVANVSHELRTPLTSLVGFIETLRGPAKNDPEAQERFLDLMETQSTRMTRIVNDLLSLSRIEMNEHTAPRDEVNLRALISTVADLLAPQAKELDVRIELALDALDTPVIGHPDELTQLFQNLIENAIKYGGTGSRVRVEASVSSGVATVSVIDEGEGIAREHIPRLTERFYRVDTARSREMGGTGL
ncbi:MAG: PAS domain-containing protein, partial [Alphaproteobacteria bacterium]|nr:PAS domain-containing protein [Alphaproteobacteria bacterium]